MKKIILWTVAILLLIFIVHRGVPALVNIYLNQNGNKIVSDMITRTSGFGGHKVTFGKITLDYNYFGTYLQLEEIRISPTQDIPEDKLKFYLSADMISVTGFKWTSFLFHNSITVDSATLEDINIRSITPPLSSPTFAPKEKEIGENKDYDVIKVKHFYLDELSIENRDSYTDSLRVQLYKLSVTAKDFELTKEDIQDPVSLFKVDAIHGKIDRARIDVDEYRQKIIVDSLKFNTRDNSMETGNFSLTSKLDKISYTRLFKKKKDWIQLTDGALRIRGMNFDSYFRKGVIEIDTLQATGLQIDVFINKRIPENYERRPAMVHTILQELGQVIHIENTFLKQGYVKVEELPDNNSPSSGHIFFSELNAHISNISNHAEKKGDNNLLNMDASAKLMGEGKVDAQIVYTLDSDRGDFRIRGTLGKMPLHKINTIVEPEAKVSLKSGTVNRLDFNIYGNDYDGTGEVIARYEDLEIEFLSNNFEKDRNLLRRIGSFMANKFVIKSSNPNKRGELKKGDVYFIREPHKSIFHYWWKLIFSGIKSTVTGDTEEQIRQKELQKPHGAHRDSK